MTSNNNFELHDYNSATLLLIVKMMRMPIQMMPMLMLDPNDANADDDEDWQVCEPKVFLGQMRSH